MAKEIERKFRVSDTLAQQLTLAESQGIIIQQGYIPTQDKTAVRVRLMGEHAFLTLKGANDGATRDEFEYPIPLDDALQMLARLCSGHHISKHRHLIQHAEHTWEVDVFHGDNQGLVIAEIELQEEHEDFAMPPWATEEVTHDPRYYNINLMKLPYKSW